MLDWVIKRVNAIGAQEGQGHAFRFLNQSQDPYKWTDKVPKDDPDFQGLLDNEEEEVIYPDISDELPGVELDEDKGAYQTVTNKPEDKLRDMAAVALNNMGINPNARLRAARQIAKDARERDGARGPAIVEADDNEIVNEITFDLPDAGLLAADQGTQLADNRDDTINIPIVPDDKGVGHCYPTQTRRSVVGNQPYDTYAPRMAFLQLGTTQAHRSVLEATRLPCMSKEEQMMATTLSTDLLKDTIDDTIHRNDLKMITTSEDEIKVWGYLMTQYNLMPGLKKFGTQGKTAAMKELTQLHVMDTWTAMDPAKLSIEE
jgi:hypothetical protein